MSEIYEAAAELREPLTRIAEALEVLVEASRRPASPARPSLAVLAEVVEDAVRAALIAPVDVRDVSRPADRDG